MTSARRPVIGWDLGGAHVKLAWLEAGLIQTVIQVPCPLWRGMDELERSVDALLARSPQGRDAMHVVTMTGEMTDLFADRAAGVRGLVDFVCAKLGDARFFTLDRGFVPGHEACAHWRSVASANWMASALLAASAEPQAVLIDIGSTTTDVVPVRDGRVVASGRDDATRLAAGELVYHGVARTPLCALGGAIRFRGVATNVMNEFFATTADVYRLTGELLREHDQHPAADNAGKSERETCERLARMIGRDAGDAPLEAWQDLARAWRRRQLRVIRANLEHVIARHGLPAAVPLVAAGCGAFLVAPLAAGAGRRDIPFERLVPVRSEHATWARVCAPSVAVALLFAREDAACGS